MCAKNIAPLHAIHECGTTMLELIEGGVAKQELQVLQSFFRGLNSIMSENITNLNEGKPLLGTHFAFPAELFYCFDVVPICFESLSYLTSAVLINGSEKFYDIASAWGHPYHTCSSQKGVMGMSLIPDYLDIDLIAIPTAPCDNTVASYQWFAEQKKVPLFVADMPYYHNERGYTYYANELKCMIDRISKQINQKPDYERLRKAVKHSSAAVRYQNEINDLRAVRPCPIESMYNPIGSCVQNFFAGRPQKETFYREMAELARYRVKHKIRGGASNLQEEKIRSYWPYMSIFFSIEFSEWLDRELNMSVVSDVFNHFFFDPIPEDATPDEMMMGLAKQSMDYPMVRQGETFAEVFIDDTIKLAKKFDVDCAIFTMHIGCKQSVSVVELIREALKDELGIPMLAIELDIGDKRMTSIDTIKKMVSDFKNTLI